MVVQPVAPDLAGPVLSAQRWANLTFLHWPVEPSAVEKFLPPGVSPDVIDGQTYVGLVPFQMRGAGPGRLPVPHFGSFCETNVRLYSVDALGRSGIVFRTLEADRLATVLLARLSLGLPYTWSRMRATHVADLWKYESVRRWPRTQGQRLRTDVTIRVGEPVEPTPLEVWLTARWGLHTKLAGRTVWVPNQHRAWPLRSAEVVGLSDDLVAGVGVDVAGPMLRPLFSPGVRTTFALPSLVKSGTPSKNR